MTSLNPPSSSRAAEVQPVSKSGTASFIGKYGGLIFVLVLIAGVLIVWLATSRITGVVAVTLANQGATALPGANVTIYSVSEEQRQRITGALFMLEQKSEEEKAANARVFRIQSGDERTSSDLAGYNNLSDTKHCFALEDVLKEIRESSVRKKSTDSQGRFTIRALPGRYLLEIVGQQDNQRFEFVQQVDLKWRTHLQLTEPSCHYSLAN